MSEIYLHIPFCNSKCVYCDFLSDRYDAEVHKKVINAMKRELLYRRNLVKDEITSIFIGGGTPSSIDPLLIDALMSDIYKYYTVIDNAEVTIETNPGTLTKDKLSAYRNMGINRISMGLQSANDDELKMLGRIHTFEQCVDNYNIARMVGFDNINIDIMQSLPYQTMDKYKKTLSKVTELEPEHISSYSLIIEEGTPLSVKTQLLEHLPDEDTERDIYHYTNEYLNKRGYNHYEVSNYAKDLYECNHNLGYWNRENYIGIGIGAASLMNDKRWSNISDIHKYIEVVELYNGDDIHEPWVDCESVECLSESDKQSEFMYLGLRKVDGVSDMAFRKCFNKSIDDVYGDIIKLHMDNGLIIKTKNGYALTDRGMDISNYILSDFV